MTTAPAFYYKYKAYEAEAEELRLLPSIYLIYNIIIETLLNREKERILPMRIEAFEVKKNGLMTEFDFSQVQYEKDYKHCVNVVSVRKDYTTQDYAETVSSFYFTDDVLEADDIDFLCFLHEDCDFEIMEQTVTVQ